MLWEHRPQVSVSVAFLNSPKLPRMKKGKQLKQEKHLVNFDYHNKNKLSLFVPLLPQQLMLVLSFCLVIDNF